MSKVFDKTTRHKDGSKTKSVKYSDGSGRTVHTNKGSTTTTRFPRSK
jgi:hypothetical protein